MITPEEIQNTVTVDSDIEKIIDNLLRERFSSSEAIIYQDELVDAYLEIHPELKRQDVFAKSVLNFEDAYRKAGWIVRYDKPDNEDYRANFTFRKPY